MDLKLTLISVILVISLVLILALIISLFIYRKEKSKLKFHRIGVQLLAISVWIIILTNVFVPPISIGAHEGVEIAIFVTSVIVGIFLIRSMMREFEMEKAIEKLITKLNKNNEDLQKLEQQKTEFISVASHQIRGPLSSIIGHVSMMMEGDYGELPDELVMPLNRVLKSGFSLSMLIGDFLNIDRIEKGELEYLIETFDLDLMLKSLIPDFRVLAKEKDLEIEKTCPNKPVMVRGDVNKTRQIITNIIDNAIKYTPSGRITIFCQIDEDHATIAVQDDGIGITRKFGEHLFEKFSRGDEAVKVDVSGNGLGLYVASTMIKAMDGEVWAESEGRGQGSTFFIKLPLSKV